MTGSRAIDLAVEVPGEAEEVWAAVATGPGITSWFVPVHVDEEEGGSVRMDVGGADVETGTVAAWEPPHRVVFEGSPSRGRRLTYEWLVTPTRPGTSAVRLRNTGFGPDADWDADYDGMGGGWPLFLENLRLHLTHFRGRRAVPVLPVATLPGSNEAAWTAFCSALGVLPAAAPGDRLRPTGDGAPELSAVVDQVIHRRAVRAYLLLLDGPVAGTGFVAAEGDGDQVTCSVYLYLYGDDAAPYGARWEAWMAATFPSPPATLV